MGSASNRCHRAREAPDAPLRLPLSGWLHSPRTLPGRIEMDGGVLVATHRRRRPRLVHRQVGRPARYCRESGSGAGRRIRRRAERSAQPGRVSELLPALTLRRVTDAATSRQP